MQDTKQEKTIKMNFFQYLFLKFEIQSLFLQTLLQIKKWSLVKNILPDELEDVCRTGAGGFDNTEESDELDTPRSFLEATSR